jgi:hypothetical protein
MQKSTISSGERLHLLGFPKGWIFPLLKLLSGINLILTTYYRPDIYVEYLRSI